MKLYLVRHGETALNEKGCYYGKTDAVLSVRGIEQAKYLQHIFKEVSFDYVVASPLVRAYNTAQIIIEERKQQIFGDSHDVVHHFLIQTGEIFQLRHVERVGQASDIQHKVCLLGQSILETKGHHREGHRAFAVVQKQAAHPLLVLGGVEQRGIDDILRPCPQRLQQVGALLLSMRRQLRCWRR